ncbi:Scr1 family TA system antitoxin-like transcriptional regulator [Streptomyces spirodelae]|uniref:Scr1 family TA system antitoxin-like transcriptional regulator n=1 Tax=Streptomyces spirodelae TaxID=2812904 RepID=UPI00355841A6
MIRAVLAVVAAAADEAVLARRVGGDKVMAEQLDRVHTVAGGLSPQADVRANGRQRSERLQPWWI